MSFKNLSEADLSGVAITEGQLNQVLFRMTPEEVLSQSEFDKAFPIVPEKFPTYDELLAHCEHVQMLRLLPVKDDEMRAHYKGLDKASLAEKLKAQLGDRRFVLAQNEYPYLAPESTHQSLLWVRDRDESHIAIAEFIAKCLVVMRVPANRVILFERPMNTSTLMVKGTFPQMRHIHLWFSFNHLVK